MEMPQKQVVARKRTFWKMVKTMFVPAQTIAKLMVGCGGKKGKRRLSMRNMQQAKEAFMRASLRGAGVNRTSSQRIRSQTHGIESDTNSNQNATPTVEVYNGHAENETPAAVSPLESNEIPQQDNGSGETFGTVLVLSLTPTAPAPLLPAPLNLEEAEILLESLTICDDSSSTNNNNVGDDTGTLHWEVVNVEVESSPLQENESNPISTRENDITNDNEHEDENVILRAECEITSRDEEKNNDICNNNGQRNRSTSLSIPSSPVVLHSEARNSDAGLTRSKTTANFSSSNDGNDFNGWRKSSIEITSNPPITLAFIPSGLCVGDRVVWVKDDHPEIGTVRWIGKIRQQFYAGIEFDKPVGNSSGIYGYGVGMYKRLFTCQLSYGRFVPVKELVLYKDYHDSGVKSGIVCVICRDDFLDTWEPDIFPREGETTCGDDIQPFNMVSTKCGHLYHWGCLDHWFSTKKRSEFHCPFCSRTMERNEVIRIFPSQL